MKHLLLLLFYSFTLLLFSFSPVFAADTTTIFCENDDPQTGIRTAIGCIQAASPRAMINQIVGWTVGLAAGAALVTIVFAGFTFTTAAGDPKKIAQAKTFLFSALSGLALLVLAVVLLNFIGVRILGLDQLGFGV